MPGERLLGRWPRKCPICGEEFFAGADWGWQLERKKKKIYFCRYNCKKKYLEKEGKKSEKKRV